MNSLIDTTFLSPPSDTLSALPPYIELCSMDPHIHARDDASMGDGRMPFVIKACAKVHSWVMFVGNVPGLTTSDALWAYKGRIDRSIPEGSGLEYGVARLVNDKSDLDDFRAGWQSRDGVRAYDAGKTFPPSVSVDGGVVLTDWKHALPIYRFFAENGIIAIFHFEIAKYKNGRKIKLENREWEAVKKWAMPIRSELPDLPMHLYHMSDRRTVEWVAEEHLKGRPTTGGVCPQYWIHIFEDLFEGPNFIGQKWCMPCYKGYRDNREVRTAMLSGLPCFGFETDFATHNNDPTQPRGVKCTSHADVCGGLTILPEDAMSLVIDTFVEAGKPEGILPFVWENTARTFGVTPKPMMVRYQRKDRVIPKEIQNGAHLYYPFLGGTNSNWSIVS